MAVGRASAAAGRAGEAGPGRHRPTPCCRRQGGGRRRRSRPGRHKWCRRDGNEDGGCRGRHVHISVPPPPVFHRERRHVGAAVVGAARGWPLHPRLSPLAASLGLRKSRQPWRQRQLCLQRARCVCEWRRRRRRGGRRRGRRRGRRGRRRCHYGGQPNGRRAATERRGGAWGAAPCRSGGAGGRSETGQGGWWRRRSCGLTGTGWAARCSDRRSCGGGQAAECAAECGTVGRGRGVAILPCPLVDPISAARVAPNVPHAAGARGGGGGIAADPTVACVVLCGWLRWRAPSRDATRAGRCRPRGLRRHGRTTGGYVRRVRARS